MSVVKRYWDSNNFLAWLNQEHNFGTLDAILRDCRAGNCQIVTSTFAFAEVFYIRGTSTPLDKVKAIEGMFAQSWIIPMEVDRTVGELSGELMREFSQRDGLRPFDSIHLASAIRARQIGQIRSFDTWEGTLINLSTQLQRVPRLRAAGSGADLFIGIPTDQAYLQFTSDPGSSTA
jgi:predicted nucleic acid-binding protein